tara:strand:- start:158 stop:427 length:270 start_codon:yes stop_codon:yes gene_type:complete
LPSGGHVKFEVLLTQNCRISLVRISYRRIRISKIAIWSTFATLVELSRTAVGNANWGGSGFFIRFDVGTAPKKREKEAYPKSFLEIGKN